MKEKILSINTIGVILVGIASLEVFYWVHKDLGNSLVLSMNMISAPILLTLGILILSRKQKKGHKSHKKRSSSFLTSKKILDDLLKQNVLTQTEYNEKLNALKNQERKKKEKNKVEFNENVLHEKEIILLNELNQLKEINILTKEEFEVKKAQLMKQFEKSRAN